MHIELNANCSKDDLLTVLAANTDIVADVFPQFVRAFKGIVQDDYFCITCSSSPISIWPEITGKVKEKETNGCALTATAEVKKYDVFINVALFIGLIYTFVSATIYAADFAGFQFVYVLCVLISRLVLYRSRRKKMIKTIHQLINEASFHNKEQFNGLS